MADFFMLLAGSLLFGWWLIDFAIFSINRWVNSKSKLSIAGSAIAGISIAGFYIRLHPSIDLGYLLIAVAGCVIGSATAFVLATHEAILRENTNWKPAKNLRGVGGWLMLLMVGLLYLSPGHSILNTMQSVADAENANPELNGLSMWHTMLFFEWDLVLISVISCIYAGLMIRSAHRPSTVKIVIYLICFIGLLPLFDNVIFYIIVDQPIFDESSFPGIVQGLIFSFVWSGYLLSSQRVHNTYIG